MFIPDELELGLVLGVDGVLVLVEEPELFLLAWAVNKAFIFASVATSAAVVPLWHAQS